MPRIRNITDQRFGRLVALEQQGRARDSHVLWLCLCDCGKTTVVPSNRLIMGTTKSCGCQRGPITHGQHGTPTYRAWVAIRQRCNNSKNKRYGGRGIKDRYPNFETFRADMGERPPGCDLHRKDNDRDYEPGNCVWLPHSEHKRLHAKVRWKALQNSGAVNLRTRTT